jgi:hypothetical protein
MFFLGRGPTRLLTFSPAGQFNFANRSRSSIEDPGRPVYSESRYFTRNLLIFHGCFIGKQMRERSTSWTLLNSFDEAPIFSYHSYHVPGKEL